MNSNEYASRALVAFSEECKRTQLQNMLRPLPTQTQERFLPAAMQAARTLEWLSPAMLIPAADGLVSGVFSSISSEAVAIVAADPTKTLFTVAAISDLHSHVEEALARFTDGRTPVEERVELFGHCIVKLLEEHGFDADQLSHTPDPTDMPIFPNLVLWRAQSTFNLVREAARIRIATAVLVLVAGDRRSTITTTICYARHSPIVS